MPCWTMGMRDQRRFGPRQTCTYRCDYGSLSSLSFPYLLMSTVFFIQDRLSDYPRHYYIHFYEGDESPDINNYGKPGDLLVHKSDGEPRVYWRMGNSIGEPSVWKLATEEELGGDVIRAPFYHDWRVSLKMVAGGPRWFCKTSRPLGLVNAKSIKASVDKLFRDNAERAQVASPIVGRADNPLL